MSCKVDASDAYTGGLLADLGMLLFAQRDADRYIKTVAESSCGEDVVAAERACFGFDHAAVSARLLEKWQFPAVLVDAVEQHHSERVGSPLAVLIRSGSLMADALWKVNPSAVARARHWLEENHDLDLDGFTDLALSCKDEILLESRLYGVHLSRRIDVEKLLSEATSQFRVMSIEAAMELDSLTAMLDGPTG
jgi:HD-like signal output (HDOD) protein